MDNLSFLKIAKHVKFDRNAPTQVNQMTQKAFDKCPDLKFVFLQLQISPFASKVRAYLDYNKIDYGWAEVDIFSKVEYKHFSPTGKVPIVIVVEGSGRATVIQESSYIITALESWRQTGDIECLRRPQAGQEDAYNLAGSSDDEKKWRQWADESFIEQVLGPNLFATEDFGKNIFDACCKNGDWANVFDWKNIQQLYSFVPVLASAKGTPGKETSTYRKELCQIANKWMDYVESTSGHFSGGEQPNLADLAVFGSLYNYSGTELVRELVLNSRIGGWYAKMLVLTNSI